MVLSASTCFSAKKDGVGRGVHVHNVYIQRKTALQKIWTSFRQICIHVHILFQGRYPLMKMFATGKRTTQHQLGLSLDVAALLPIFIQPVALTELIEIHPHWCWKQVVIISALIELSCCCSEAQLSAVCYMYLVCELNKTNICLPSSWPTVTRVYILIPLWYWLFSWQEWIQVYSFLALIIFITTLRFYSFMVLIIFITSLRLYSFWALIIFKTRVYIFIPFFASIIFMTRVYIFIPFLALIIFMTRVCICITLWHWSFSWNGIHSDL